MKLFCFIIVLIVNANANVNVVCKAGIMDNKNAKIYINKLLIKEPKNVECTLKLANIHLKNGELLKGYKLISRAFEINPAKVKKSDISKILPDALKITKLAEKAKEDKNKFLWNQVGDNFFDMGVYSESSQAYKNSLLIDANQSNIGLKLALSYQKSNYINESAKQLEILIKQNEKNFYANYYLGKILRYSFNDEKNAVHHLKKAKSILLEDKKEFTKTQYPTFLNDINAELGK